MTFVAEMIRGVGALPAQCDSDVVTDAATQDMTAICATFDGEFEHFQALWAMHLLRDAYLDDEDDAGPVPPSEAKTAWETRGGAHERIYAVGTAVVGIRFVAGEIIVVWQTG